MKVRGLGDVTYLQPPRHKLSIPSKPSNLPDSIIFLERTARTSLLLLRLFQFTLPLLKLTFHADSGELVSPRLFRSIYADGTSARHYRDDVPGSGHRRPIRCRYERLYVYAGRSFFQTA